MARKRSAPWLVVPLLVLLLACGLGLFLLRRARERRVDGERQRQAAQYDRGPKLFVAPVVGTPPEREVTLPSEIRAFNQSTLYAKTAGYLTEIRVDKGDVVHANEILARVASPETDRAVANAYADFVNKERFYRREQALVQKKYVAIQDYENAKYAADESLAVLQQERALQAYEIIRAPFDGTITGRYVDPGALIPTGASATSGAQPVVDIADLNRIRVALFVGQDIAPFVTDRTGATLQQDERPALKIETRVTRVSGALDPRSRTMLCEIWLDNRPYRLQPGSWVRVTLHVQVPPLPTIPSEGIFLRNGVRLAAIVRNSRVSFVPVQPGFDDGTHVQVKAGLKTGEVVALNVPADLGAGDPIQPVARPKAADGSHGRPPR